MSVAVRNCRAAGAWWGALQSEGLEHVVICPGSRSSVLAIAASRTENLRVHVGIDERSAAFFALGLAKSTRRPVALVCTSGTAAANFLPAVCEAKQSSTPLIIVTADRPPELHDAGAPQTMPQTGLFGRYVAFEYGLPAPGEAVQDSTYALFAKRAAVNAIEHLAPVHVNFPFREPLLPADDEWPKRDNAVRTVAHLDNSLHRYAPRLQDLLLASRNPVLIAGPGTAHSSERDDILRWAASWGMTVFADVSSGLRGGARTESDPRLPFYEGLLAADTSLPAPDLILLSGSAPTSKRLAQWSDAQDCPRAGIHPTACIGPSNGLHNVFAGRLGDYVARHAAQPVTRLRSAAWESAFQYAQALQRTVSGAAELHPEQKFAGSLGGAVPDDSVLFLSNSMPIRDFDGFFWPNTAQTIYANRGVNGIDGVVSTALGAAVGAGKPLTAIIGDVAFLHDINGLDLLRQTDVSGVIVVIDNQGGKIFGELPVRRYPEYERLFVTPPRADIQQLAGAFGLEVETTVSVDSTVEAVDAAHRKSGFRLVVFRVPASDCKTRQDGWTALTAKLVTEAA